ncbi:MAG: SRPBCC domain-containing protein [Actinobacteria bacterium]|nr:SRPBCC domain-containing protein [Actinomycetota bacterium]
MDRTSVTRHVELDLTVDELWAMIADGGRWAEWLVDASTVEVTPGADGTVIDDGERRGVRVHTVEHGHRIGFEWWNDDERSEVELEIVPGDERTGLRITETFARAGAASARASFAWDVRLLVLCLGTAALART